MLGHLIYSYNHIDDVKINQEISKKLYADKFGGSFLVYCHNGKKEFGYQKYLEDKLIKIKNRGHFQGAADLINSGLKYFNKHKIKDLKYVLITAADTWCLDVNFLEKIINEMKKENKVVACSSWAKNKFPEKPNGFSTDFFIIDIEWNRKAKIWPLNYKNFYNGFKNIYSLLYSQPILEVAFQYKFHKYFLKKFKDNDVWRNRDKSLYRMVEREPVHNNTGRTDDWSEIGLYTSPFPKTKQEILKKKNLNLGKFSEKLINAKNLDYYNNYEQNFN